MNFFCPDCQQVTERTGRAQKRCKPCAKKRTSKLGWKRQREAVAKIKARRMSQKLQSSSFLEQQ